jgi:hypothetical protein
MLRLSRVIVLFFVLFGGMPMLHALVRNRIISRRLFSKYAAPKLLQGEDRVHSLESLKLAGWTLVDGRDAVKKVIHSVSTFFFKLNRTYLVCLYFFLCEAHFDYFSMIYLPAFRGILDVHFFKLCGGLRLYE